MNITFGILNVLKHGNKHDLIHFVTSLVLSGIRLLTLELLALEWQKFYSFEHEYLWGQLANLDQILCVASLGVGKGCIMFWGRLDHNSGVHGNRNPPLTYNGENGVSTFSQLLLTRSFFFFFFHFTPRKYWLITQEAVAPSRKIVDWDVKPQHKQNPILFILAGNEDMHKISDEFEFWPDRTTDYGVSCPWASKKFPIDL